MTLPGRGEGRAIQAEGAISKQLERFKIVYCASGTVSSPDIIENKKSWNYLFS